MGHKIEQRYRLEREIGSGGMATVHLATDLRHDRPVALKFLKSELGALLGEERFSREIRTVARLRHPFILPLHDSGVADGILYYVMPYVDGESLRARLNREKKLAIADAVQITRQLADALAYAHSEGVVHRDIKPENVLLTKQGHALLADFGIARTILEGKGDRLTETGMLLGTPEYMSPEQITNEGGVDQRSDIYSLGCLLYEMITGVAPFTGRSTLAIIAGQVNNPVPSVIERRPEVRPSLAMAIEKSLSKDPAGRFATASDFAEAIKTVSGGQHDTEAASSVSIAVLPVVNMSGDKDNEYFSDGITEELISALARVREIRVVSRTSTFAFKGKDLSAREIGARLGVAYVIEGSARRAGNRLRVNAKLIRTSDDSLLWSETYERMMEDVFTVQDDIVNSIVGTLTETLQLGHMRGVSAVPQTSNLDAFNLYLLGRYHWNKRTEADIREARAYFLKAIEADPKYAPSHAGLADACILMASWGFVPASEVYPEAAAAARRAIDLDAGAAEGHASLGLIKFNYHWDWDGAEAELRKAVALNPSYATAYRWLSTVLVSTGHSAEARLLAKRAVDLDPMSVLSHMNYGHVDYFSGNFEVAAEQYMRVAAMESSFYRAHMWRAQSLAFAGRKEEAIAEARTAVSLSNDLPMMLAYLAIALAVVGEQSESRALLQRVMSAGFVPPIYIAMLHAALGEEEDAIDWLERAYDERSDWVSSIGVQPVFKRLASNGRFLQLLERLRLPKPAAA